MSIKIVTGNANIPLAEAACKYLGQSLTDVRTGKYSDQESRVQIFESVRGNDVFVIQPTCPSVNDNVMELLILLDALKRSSPQRITAIIPYYGYSRQDRKHGPREPITAKLIADLISIAGPSRILFCDLHAIQIQGFFNIPADDLCVDSLVLEFLSENQFTGSNTTIIAANAGGARRARRIAKAIKAKMALIENRVEKNTKVMKVVGSLLENAFIIDDMVDTGTRIAQTANVLKATGAKKVYAWATHAVLSGDVQKLQDSEVDKVIVTDSIPIPPEKAISKLEVVSIAPMLAEAIRRIHNEESMSDLFALEDY